MYHFALRIDQGTGSEAVDLAPMVTVDDQKASILKMSRDVSVILLLGKTHRILLNQSSKFTLPI